jgi:hypothetical protein
MAGQKARSAVLLSLVPAIHAFLMNEDVDARHKAGHDGVNTEPAPYSAGFALAEAASDAAFAAASACAFFSTMRTDQIEPS